MSLLHSIFLSSGDLNNTPGIYHLYLSLECLSSSPIPLLSEGDQGQYSSHTSLVKGPHTAFGSCLPQPSPIFFYLPTWKGAAQAGLCSGGGLCWRTMPTQGVMEWGISGAARLCSWFCSSWPKRQTCWGCCLPLCGSWRLGQPKPCTTWSLAAGLISAGRVGGVCMSLPQTWTAEVSWEAGASPEGWGSTPEDGAAQHSASMLKPLCPGTLGQLLSTGD